MKVNRPVDGQVRDGGLTLVEVATALSLFAGVALAASLTLMHGVRHRRQSSEQYLVINAMRDLLAEIQETANKPQNLITKEGIGAVYSKYHNRNFPVPALSSGQIRVICFPNEATVPVALGGPQDLNFDGDAQDNHGNQANGSDLKLVPMTLVLTFQQEGVNYTFTRQRLVSKTTD